MPTPSPNPAPSTTPEVSSTPDKPAEPATPPAVQSVNVEKSPGQQLSGDLVGGNQSTLNQLEARPEETASGRLGTGTASAQSLDPKAPQASQGFAGRAESTDAAQQPEPTQPQKLQTLITSPEERVQQQKDIIGQPRGLTPETAKQILTPDKPLSPGPTLQGVKLPDKGAQLQDARVRYAEAQTGTASDAAPASGRSPSGATTFGPPTGQFTGEAGSTKDVPTKGGNYIEPPPKDPDIGKPDKPQPMIRGETPPLTKAQAYQTAVEAAKAANIKDPYTAAAIAMKEGGWLQRGKGGVFDRTGGTNPFGQTGNKGAIGTVKGADQQEHAVYRDLKDGFKAHFARWGENYRDSPRETLQNMVQRGYNRTDPNWVKDILAIRSRMSTALER